MIDWLIIAEKESEAMGIVKGIFDKGNPSGRLTHGGIQGSNLSSILSGRVAVTRAQGHLFEMAYPDKQDPKYNRKGEPVVDDWGITTSSGWKSNEDMLKIYPVHLDTEHDRIKFVPRSSKHKELAYNIKRLFVDAKNIIVATDADAEGEMIFRNWAKIMIGLGKIDWSRLYRVTVESLDERSIRKSFTETLECYDHMTGKLGKYYQSLAPRGYARSIADYEYGMTYSLLGQTVAERLGMRTKGSHGVWGRLKNTILGHVREAEVAHDSFVPSSQYRIDLKAANGALLHGYDHLVFKTKELAQEFLDGGHLPSKANIRLVNRTTNTKAPKLFSRAELLIAAGRKVSRTPDWAKILQEDYEQFKVLSYPRTDSQHIGHSEYALLQQYVQSPTAQRLLQTEFHRICDKHGLHEQFDVDTTRGNEKRWVDDEKVIPHYALIPDPENVISDPLYTSLPTDNQNLYKVALYQTMSIFLPESVAVKTQATALMDADGKPVFSGSFQKVQTQGWRLLLDEIANNSEAPEQGSQEVSYVITEVKATQPSLLDELSLLSLLKRLNEGTSATRDATISQMVKNQGVVYDSKRKKTLRVNEALGPVVDLMLEHQWIDMQQTAQWQMQLDQITAHEQADQFIETVRHQTAVLQHRIMQAMNIPV